MYLSDYTFPPNHYHTSSTDDQGHIRGVRLCLLGEMCNRNDPAYTLIGERLSKDKPINSILGRYKQILKLRVGDIIPLEAKWIGIGLNEGEFYLFYELEIEVNFNEEKN